MSELISDVRIFPINHDRLKANVSFTVAKAFAVKAKLVKNNQGLMVSMPSESFMKDGEKVYKDLVFPITTEVRTEMTKKIVEAYKEKQGEVNTDGKSETKGQSLPF